MVDGKMAKVYNGAGGAACQLCTATKFDLNENISLEMVFNQSDYSKRKATIRRS